MSFSCICGLDTKKHKQLLFAQDLSERLQASTKKHKDKLARFGALK